MLPPSSGFVGVSVLDAGIPPNPQHILGATGAQAVVAGGFGGVCLPRWREWRVAMLTESEFFRKLWRI